MGKKVYLAGPEVFFNEAASISQAQKLCCALRGLKGLVPLDNEIPQTNSKQETAEAIVRGNLKMIQACDYVVANLSNFRGYKRHPCCDSGTAWECGYATALQKPVLAYTSDIKSIPRIMRRFIGYRLVGKLPKALEFVTKYGLRFEDIPTPKFSRIIRLDPMRPAIQDANAFGAFCLGYAFGIGKNVAYTISDKRSLIEKYGPIDRNGVRFEDFDMPVNIMIGMNHKLK